MRAASSIVKHRAPEPSEADHRRRAAASGMTRSGQFEGGEYSLHLAFAPDEDIDGAFEAMCLETGEMLLVSGWLFSFEEDEQP